MIECLPIMHDNQRSVLQANNKQTNLHTFLSGNLESPLGPSWLTSVPASISSPSLPAHSVYCHLCISSSSVRHHSLLRWVETLCFLHECSIHGSILSSSPREVLLLTCSVPEVPSCTQASLTPRKDYSVL